VIQWILAFSVLGRMGWDGLFVIKYQVLRDAAEIHEVLVLDILIY
jgi:hypothetical protein